MLDGPGGDLHALLGVDRDLPTDRLRLAYEAQVNAAVRGNDRRRALALSRAFDALPAATRRAMYASSPAEDRWVPPAGAVRRRRVRRTRTTGGDPVWRTAFVVVGALAAVGAFLWWLGVLPVG